MRSRFWTRPAARTAVLLALLAAPPTLTPTPSAALMAAPDQAPPPNVQALTRVLANRRAPTVERVAAAQELGRANEPRSRRALERALRDREPDVRAAAARALALVGDARSLQALRRLRPDAELYVRAQVGHAIAQLTGDTTPRARVRVGNIAVAPGVVQPRETTQAVRDEAGQMLTSLRRTLVHDTEPPRPDDHSPDAVLRGADGALFLRLDIAVTALTYVVTDGVATVRVELELALSNDPGLLVRAVDTTSATVRANINPHNTERQRQQMLTAAIRAAITGAARNLDGGIESAHSAR